MAEAFPDSASVETSIEYRDSTRLLMENEKRNIPLSSSSSPSVVKIIPMEISGADKTERRVRKIASALSAAASNDPLQETIAITPDSKPPLPKKSILKPTCVSRYDPGVRITPEEFRTNLTIQTPIATHDRAPLTQNDELAIEFLRSDEPTNLEITTSPGSDETVERISWFQHYLNWSNSAVYSLYILPFLFVMIGLLCFGCYMGIAYYNSCDLYEEMPILLEALGIAGIIGFSGRIYYVLSKRRSWPSYKSRYTSFIGVYIFIFFYILDLSVVAIRQKRPSAHSKSPYYCDPIFYSFVYWNNWSILLILLIVGVVHAPAVVQALGEFFFC